MNLVYIEKNYDRAKAIKEIAKAMRLKATVTFYREDVWTEKKDYYKITVKGLKNDKEIERLDKILDILYK